MILSLCLHNTIPYSDNILGGCKLSAPFHWGPLGQCGVLYAAQEFSLWLGPRIRMKALQNTPQHCNPSKEEGKKIMAFDCDFSPLEQNVKKVDMY